jgi:beta-lactamase regulating signal transducer with metallopeptidase domain
MSAAFDWNVWRPFFTTLALGTTLIVLAGWVGQRWITSMAWRRTIWQVAFLAIGLLAAMEITGVGRGLWGWLAPQPQPPTDTHRLVEARVIGEPDSRMLLAQDSRETVAASAPRTPVSAAKPTPIRWPGVIWLAGFGVTMAWMATARLVFTLFVPRREQRDEAVLAKVKLIASKLGLSRTVSVAETHGLTGPIAFGLLRPGISLPEGFSRRFTGEQQDAMLAHELAHLAARDPFWHALADATTAMLWWHPLVWLAKRELRVASEGVADEASLVVENGPQVLAECLVELGGRLTSARSAGWLGMADAEFRSSLGKRVTRLISLDDCSWEPMCRSRLWMARTAVPLALVTVVLAATAWAQPVQDSSLRQAFQRSVLGLALAVALPQTPAAAVTNSTESSSVEPAKTTSGRATIHRKLDSIRLKEISFSGAPLNEVVEKLAGTIRENDPDGKGINFIVSDTTQAGQKVAAVDPATGLLQPRPFPITNVIIHLAPPLRDVTIRQALDAIVKVAGSPLRYGVEDYAVVFSAIPPFYTRWFRVDPKSFSQALSEPPTTNMDQAIREAINAPPVLVDSPSPGKTYITRVTPIGEDATGKARQFFTKAGVDFTVPGKYFAFNERLGQLMVRATLEDLDVIERSIHWLVRSPPQLTIEVKFCEVPTKDKRALGFDWLLGLTNGISNENWLLGLTNWTSYESNLVSKGFLTDAQYRVVLRALEQRTGVNILTPPKVTTLSGRQAQVKTVNVRYVVTDYDLSELVSNAVARAIAPNEIKPMAEQFELGPVLDVVPYVRADGHSIHMTVIPTITEFIGYDIGDGPRREIITTSDGRKEYVILPPEPRPMFRKRQIVSSVTAWDGQTIMLAGGSDLLLSNPNKNQPLREGTRLPEPKKETTLLVFITPTLIDPAGNRIHRPEEIPAGIPPQEDAPPRR